jgi:hypothetical protein
VLPSLKIDTSKWSPVWVKSILTFLEEEYLQLQIGSKVKSGIWPWYLIPFFVSLILWDGWESYNLKNWGKMVWKKYFSYYTFYHLNEWQPFAGSICQYEVWTKTLVSPLAIVTYVCLMPFLAFQMTLFFKVLSFCKRKSLCENVQNAVANWTTGKCWPHIRACPYHIHNQGHTLFHSAQPAGYGPHLDLAPLGLLLCGCPFLFLEWGTSWGQAENVASQKPQQIPPGRFWNPLALALLFATGFHQPDWPVLTLTS